MPKINFSPKFFKDERNRAYSDWELAFWRELFQNSIDQNASLIDITIEQDGPFVAIAFADNGPGMSREVLTEVYFQVGESTKTDDPTMIGGMGRARLMTCFAMKSYVIVSQDYRVVGARDNYDVFDHLWTNGCRLEIKCDDTSIDVMLKKLEQFLSESRVEAAVLVNGGRVYTRAPLRGKHVRDLEIDGESFARVYVNKTSGRGDVLVRVKGVCMFKIGSDASAQVTIELLPEKSRDALTATRDALRWDYRRALSRFLADLAVNTGSALNSRFGKQTTVVANGGAKKRYFSQQPRPSKKKTKGSVEENNVVVPQPDRNRERSAAYMTTVTEQNSAFEESEPVHPFQGWLQRTFGDLYMFDETDKPAIRKVMGAYNPKKWTLTEVNGRPHRKGGNIIRVLLMWQTAVEYALEVAAPALGKQDLSFNFGFVFGEHTAQHREQNDSHIFSLNPVDDQGKLRYSVTQRRDLKWIMALAKHEVTHVAQSWHDEDFARLREAVDAEFDEAEALRRMKIALRNAEI
jgi:hypothetical protein